MPLTRVSRAPLSWKPAHYDRRLEEHLMQLSFSYLSALGAAAIFLCSGPNALAQGTVGACCAPTPNGGVQCTNTTQAQCTAMGGTFHNVLCGPNTCGSTVMGACCVIVPGAPNGTCTN